jgi:hypothetical protein
MKQVRDELELTGVKDYLLGMVEDPAFATLSAYRADVAKWPDHKISFVDIHLTYLRNHPQVNSEDYLSNLRLRSRVRPNKYSS